MRLIFWKRHTKKFFLLTASALLLNSCARELHDDLYTEDAVNHSYTTKLATVIDRRVVRIQESDKLRRNEVGTIGGGVTGAVAGSSVGKGKGSTLGGIVGAVAGATAGALIEKEVNKQNAFEYVIQLHNADELRTIIQTGQAIPVGAEVFFMEAQGQGRSRIRPRSSTLS